MYVKALISSRIFLRIRQKEESAKITVTKHELFTYNVCTKKNPFTMFSFALSQSFIINKTVSKERVLIKWIFKKNIGLK